MKTNKGGEVKTVKHTGYTTDIITEKSLAWLKDDRDPDKPFMLMSQHKAPHRNWQPAPRHLHLYDELDIPEPATLFDDYAGRGTASKEQAMTIKSHMNPRDLKLQPLLGSPPNNRQHGTPPTIRKTKPSTTPSSKDANS